MPAPRISAPHSGSRLRSLAGAARWLGAVVSLGFVLYAGRHNRHILLTVLFVGWVLLPYFGLVAVGRIAARSRLDIANAIHASTLVLALVSPAIYGVASILRPGHAATFAFLVVPALSWLTIGMLSLARRLPPR